MMIRNLIIITLLLLSSSLATQAQNVVEPKNDIAPPEESAETKDTVTQKTEEGDVLVASLGRQNHGTITRKRLMSVNTIHIYNLTQLKKSKGDFTQTDLYYVDSFRFRLLDPEGNVRIDTEVEGSRLPVDVRKKLNRVFAGSTVWISDIYGSDPSGKEHKVGDIKIEVTD